MSASAGGGSSGAAARWARVSSYAACARGDVDATRLEPTHHVLEAPPLDAADQVGRRDRALVEEELRRVHALVAELPDGLHHREARMPLLDDETGHPLVAGLGLRVGEGEERERVPLAPVGDEHLGPGDQ